MDPTSPPTHPPSLHLFVVTSGLGTAPRLQVVQFWNLPGGTLPARPLKSQAVHLAASSRLAGFLQVRVWQPGTQMPLPVRGNESVTRSWDSCLLSVSTWFSHRANLKTHSRLGLKPRTVTGPGDGAQCPKAALRSTAEASLEGDGCLSVGTAPRGGKYQVSLQTPRHDCVHLSPGIRPLPSLQATGPDRLGAFHG